MCCRYYTDDTTEQEVRKLTKDPDLRIAGGDIHPSDPATVLIGSGNGLAGENMLWGFTGQEGQGLLINARAETVSKRRVFQDSVMSRRCAIPAKGFYEWSPVKEKYQFEDPGRTLYMAGCFDTQGHFVIITTAANESVLPVHERMPLLLPEEDVQLWIQKSEYMTAFLQKIPRSLRRWTDYQQMSLFD